MSCGNDFKESKTYYESGKLKSKSLTKDGLMNGESVEYYESGSIQSISNWKGGVQIGENRHFYENGQIESISYLDSGRMHGNMKLYDSVGNLLEDANWVKGKLHGTRLQYHSNGNLKLKGEYLMDKPIGKFKYYNTDGLIIRSVDYDGGKSENSEEEFDIIFKAKNDTVKSGETYELEIFFKNPKGDSISLIFGNLDSRYKLIDTLYIPEINSNRAYYSVKVPTVSGANQVQGIIQDIKIEKDRLAIKSMPFVQDYYVID